jgi:hypothetical protein
VPEAIDSQPYELDDHEGPNPEPGCLGLHGVLLYAGGSPSRSGQWTFLGQHVEGGGSGEATTHGS